MGDLWLWHPPVGVWIGTLGLLGVLVPLIRDINKIGRREKAIWTFIMFSLLLLEIKSVYQDRNEHDKQQSEARARQAASFTEIADGINGAITLSQQQFHTTIQQQSEQFDATMSKAEENLNHVTGGNSYPVIEMIPVPMENTTNKLRLSLSITGKNPLYDVVVTMRKLPLPKTVSLTGFVTTGTQPDIIPEFSEPSVSSTQAHLLPVPIEPSMSGQSDYQLSTSARNGSFTEKLHVRYSGAIETNANGVTLPWEQSYEITRRDGRKERIIFKRKWQKTNTPNTFVTTQPPMPRDTN
ncbi:MAG: hypothetical protein WB762_10865 [Candidatus Sulfotelmatobacter sp.]